MSLRTKACKAVAASQTGVVLLFACSTLLTSCGGGGGPIPSPPSLPPQAPPPLAIATNTLPDAVQVTSYSFTLQATGGTGVKRWSVRPGSSLPNSLLLMETGQIFGNPVALGTFSFEVEVRDSATPPQVATKTLSLRVFERLFVSTSSLPGAQLGLPYSATITAFGGAAPYQWSMLSGALLTGLSLNGQTGEISGTPTSAGPAAFVVQVTDSSSPPQFSAVNLSIQIATALAITSANFPNGKLGRPYLMHPGFSINLVAMGGTSPRRWAVSAGSLPPGINLTIDGSVFGTPTAIGTYNFTVQITDATSPPQTDARSFTVLIDEFIITTKPGDLPLGVIGQPYSATLSASGGMPPFTWTVMPGSFFGIPGLPPGLTVDSLPGIISGIPTGVGQYGIDIEVTDSSNPQLNDRVLGTISINPLPTFPPTNLDDAILGRSYNESAGFFGGLPPYAFRITAGSLPPGIQIPSVPLFGFSVPFTGMPSTTGNFPFTLEVADSSTPPLTASASLSIQVNDLLQQTTVSLPPGAIGVPYNASFTATGGEPPLTWQFSGSLPNGLVFDPTSATIVGTPLRDVSHSVTATVTDSSTPPQSSFASFQLTINRQLHIMTTLLPPAVIGRPYTAMLTAIGGAGNLSWSLASGSLPAGLILDSTSGVISGLATTEETQSFTVQASDMSQPPQIGTRTLMLDARTMTGRNDSAATATPLSSGRFGASISPSVDPTGTVFAADNDFYRLAANGGTFVTIHTFAQRLQPSSPMDSVIEIVDENGVRLATCDPFGSFNPTSYTQPCMNDDSQISGGTLDSALSFLVPGPAGTPITFYVRVLDWTGDARPDFRYEISIFGAN